LKRFAKADFRGNDGKGEIRTFYEDIKNEGFMKRNFSQSFTKYCFKIIDIGVSCG